MFSLNSANYATSYVRINYDFEFVAMITAAKQSGLYPSLSLSQVVVEHGGLPKRHPPLKWSGNGKGKWGAPKLRTRASCLFFDSLHQLTLPGKKAHSLGWSCRGESRHDSRPRRAFSWLLMSFSCIFMSSAKSIVVRKGSDLKRIYGTNVKKRLSLSCGEGHSYTFLLWKSTFDFCLSEEW